MKLFILLAFLTACAYGQQLEPKSKPEATVAEQVQSGPRVFLQAASHGRGWNANRDQSMEMSKDFEKNCSDVRITINQQMADYTIVLNHIEAGFSRDNQFQIADKNGDLITRTKEGGSIKTGVKKACVAIMADWSKKQH